MVQHILSIAGFSDVIGAVMPTAIMSSATVMKTKMNAARFGAALAGACTRRV